MEIDDLKFIFHSNLPTLQETSALKIGLNFWRHEISTHRSNIAFKLPELFSNINHDEVVSKVTQLFLPASIKSLLKNCIKSMGREIGTWAGYHDYHVSVYNFATDGNFLEYFDLLVWRPNGTICYGQTAANLLNYQNLDNLHKFKLACLYCLEEKIMKLWPLVSVKYQIDDVDFNTKPFIHYWFHILLNQIENFPLLHFNSLAKRMIYQCGIDNWPAINYFWDQLDEESQIERILHIFDMIGGKCIDYLVSKLTDPKWDEFLRIIGEKLINFLIDQRSSKFQYILPVWMRIRRNFDEKQFIRLIERTWTLKTDFESDHDEENCTFCVIWATSPNSLKEIVLDKIFSKQRVHKYENQPLKGFPRNTACLINVFESATITVRSLLWNENWYNLIKGTRPQHLSQLLDLCLIDEYRIVEFKNHNLADLGNLDVLKYSIELIRQRCYDELNQFLDFCYSSNHQQKLKGQFKQKILQFCVTKAHNVYGYEHLSELDMLDKFIKDTFQDTQTEKEYKDTMVLHMVLRKEFSSFLINCEFQLIRNFLTVFVSSPNTVERVKKCIFDHCRQCLKEGEIRKKLLGRGCSEKFLEWSSPGFENFLRWCLPGERYIVL